MMVADPGPRRWRQHSAEFKASIIAACAQPGISIAAVALANGLNAGMLRRWVAETPGGSHAPPANRARSAADHASASAGMAAPGFVPLSLPPPRGEPICIKVQRNGTSIKVNWPIDAAADCASWLRQLLR